MSFDINPPSRNLSNVQASAKSQDGGAGNTGYFMRGQQEEDTGFRFRDTGSDSFERSNAGEEEDTGFLTLFLRFLEELIEKIKAFFIRGNK